MKMKSKMLVILTLFALLSVPLGAWAKKTKNPDPEPFMGPTTEQSIQVRFAATVNLPMDAPPRTEFFSESFANTGFDEAQLAELVRAGKVQVIYWTKDTGKLWTAGLLNGKAYYWRLVNENEAVVVVAKGDYWVPWFLLGCNNPVRTDVPDGPVTMAPAPPAPVAPPQQHSEVMVEQMVCVQNGIVFMVSDLTTYPGYSSSVNFNWMYRPTTCYKIQEKIKLSGGAR